MALVELYPGDNITSIVSGSPAGTDYLLKAGLHRMHTFNLKNGDSVVGENGSKMVGSQVLTGWTKEGSYWYVGGISDNFEKLYSISNFDLYQDTTFKRPGWAVDLFSNGVMLDHVDQKTQLSAGRWWFDDPNNRVYIAQDPATLGVIELSRTRNAITSSATGLYIENLHIAQYANPTQNGAIHLSSAEDMQVLFCTLEWNHALGLKYGDRAVVRNCILQNNGQLGVGGGATNNELFDLVFENNLLRWNNRARYKPTFEAGGSKFSHTHRGLIRNNLVYSNFGKGLWLDVDNGYFGANIVEHNIVYDNDYEGIYSEIGWDCIIRHNYSSGNDDVSRATTDMSHCQIFISNSSNTEVYNNIVVVEAAGGNGIGVKQRYRGNSTISGGGEWLAQNNYIHDNIIYYMSTPPTRSLSGANGWNYRDDILFNPAKNRFANNAYKVKSTNQYWWRWQYANRRLSDVQTNYQNELGSTESTSWSESETAVPTWSVTNVGAGASGGSSEPITDAAGLNTVYRQKMLDIPDLFRLYVLNDVPPTTTVKDHSSNNASATAADTTFGLNGIGDGTTSCQLISGGAASYINFYSVAFDSGFDREEFTVTLWAKAGDWTTTEADTWLKIGEGGDPDTFLLAIGKAAAANTVQTYININGDEQTHSIFVPSQVAANNGWINIVVQRSRSAGEFSIYINNTLFTAPGNPDPAQASTVLNGLALIGAESLIDAGSNARLAYVGIYNRALDTTEIENLSTYNVSPVVAEVPAQYWLEGQTISIQVNAYDPNPNDTLTYSATGLPVGLSINANTGLISAVATEGMTSADPYTVTVTVADNNGAEAAIVFALYIIAVADPPAPSPGDTYKETIQAIPDLYAYYTFEEASGTVLVDHGPNNLDGTLKDVTLSVEGIGDGLTAGRFSRSAASWARFWSSGWDAGFNRNAFSIFVWFKLGSTEWGDANVYYTYIIGTTATGTGRFISYIRKNVANNLRWYIWSNTAAESHDYTFSPAAGWHCVGITRDTTGDVVYYLDGVQIATDDGLPSGTGTSINSNRGLIGAVSDNPGSEASSNMDISHTIMVNRALTAQEVLDIWQYNEPPSVAVIENQSHDVGEAVLLQVVAADNNAADTLDYEATGLPPGLSINASNGLISGTVTTPGTYNVTVTVNDNGMPPKSTNVSFTWTVVQPFTTPVIIPQVSPGQTSEGNVYSFQPQLDTPRPAEVLWSCSSLPNDHYWTINPQTGLVEGYWDYGDAGTHYFTVTARNVQKPELSDTEVFVVEVLNTNRKPVIAPISDYTVIEGLPIDPIYIDVYDPDDDSFTTTLYPLPDGLTFNSSTRFLTGTPSFSSAGTYSIQVTVTDAGDPPRTATATFSLTVQNQNRPPVWNSNVGNRTNTVGDIISIPLDASDPDGDALTYEAYNLPKGVVVSGANLIGNIQDGAETLSPYRPIIAVQDVHGASALQTFFWTINPAVDTTARFRIYVDWNNDGDFTDSIDDISADVIDLSWRNGMGKPYQDVADEASATITVRNTDGKYNPENTASPLFGLLKPGRPIKIVASDVNGTYPLWYGWLNFPTGGWKPMGLFTGKHTVSFQASGAKRYIQELTARIPSFGTQVTGDEIIKVVLDQVGLERLSDQSLIQVGATQFDEWIDPTEKNGHQLISEITMAERGRFYFNSEGRPVWWNRHYLLNNFSVVATVTTQAGQYKPLNLDYSYGGNIRNVVRVAAEPVVIEGESEQLWALDQPLVLAQGETIKFEARLRTENGQYAGATNITHEIEYTSGVAFVSITPRGGIAEVELRNISVAVTIISAFRLFGIPSVERNNYTVEIADEESVAEYGRHPYNLNLGPLSKYIDTKSIGEYELIKNKQPRGTVARISYKRKADGVDNAHLIKWQIGDQLRIVVPEYNHDAYYYIIGEQHAWNSQIHEATFVLEPGAPTRFWALGVPGFTELGETTILGY
ncbi:MAG: hypothetical protein OHK0046_47980 [Anaerolineae bacterium]